MKLSFYQYILSPRRAPQFTHNFVWCVSSHMHSCTLTHICCLCIIHMQFGSVQRGSYCLHILAFSLSLGDICLIVMATQSSIMRRDSSLHTIPTEDKQLVSICPTTVLYRSPMYTAFVFMCKYVFRVISRRRIAWPNVTYI